MGTSASPAATGPIRRPCWSTTAMTNMNPLKPIENGTTRIRPLRSDCRRSRLGGTSGVRPSRSARRSVR